MKDIAAEFSTASGQTLGLGLGAVLIAAAWLLLAREERASVKQPFILLALHAVARALLGLTTDPSTLHTTLRLVALSLLLLAIGRGLVLVLVDGLLGHRLKRPLPKIIRDILQALVYFLLLLTFLQQLGVEPGQLLTTSALLTAALGLALQDTLGNLVAGLSVQMQEPFTVGDWIQYDDDPKKIGRVTDVNWRATTLLTLDDFQIVVPNGQLAKAAVKVFTRPTKVVRRSVYVHVGYAVAPRTVRNLILEAIEGAPLILTKPAPSVITNAFGDSGVEYWVRYYIEEFGKRDLADSGVRDRIWYTLRRNHVEIPYPQRVVHMSDSTDAARERERAAAVAEARQALGKVDFLSVLQEDLLGELAERAVSRLFAKGEPIVRQGDDSAELFIVKRGQVVVVLGAGESEREVSRLSEGQFFGEMALVTGERRKATVRAASESELLVITRAAFEEVLHRAPDVIAELSTVLAKRQVELGHHEEAMSKEDADEVVERESSALIGKIKKLFSI